MRVMVIAALPGAGAVMTAAGVLRAVGIVMADRRILAPAVVAVPAMVAIPVVAALGAGASLRIPVPAADQTVAAVELRATVPRGGYFETAVVAATLAAIVLMNAFISAAANRA